MMRDFVLKPFFNLIRFDKPIGSILLGIPCLWGVALCSSSVGVQRSLLWGGIFLLGAVLLRSAGCIINDLFDARFDRDVERTKERPLASGILTKTQAFFFLVFILLGSLFIFINLTHEAKIFSLIAFAIAVVYPLMKRFFPIPQFVLGLAFNSGVIVAVAQLRPELLWSPSPWLLYVAGIFWTLYYDTVYAVQDMKDDEKLGLYSSALFFKNHLKQALSIFCGGMIFCVFLAGIYLQADLWYFIALIFMILDVGYVLYKMDLRQPKRGGAYFLKSMFMGMEVLFNLIFFLP